MAIDGILVVAKPIGPTSHDVVALVRRLAGTKRVGHGGTLDPFASGVLPLFLGRATRMLEYHLGDGKSYRATVCFGATSTTDDLEGELTPSGTAPTRSAVEAALAAFTGTLTQVPPAYSAIKIGGRRAYALARAGERPVLAPRTITVSQLVLVDWDASDPERPVAVLDLECSAGTYVRALARDLGAALGSAAYLGALSRTASGGFRLEAAHDLEAIRAAAADGSLERLVLPPDVGLEAIPALTLSPEEVADLARGQLISPIDRGGQDGRSGGPVRVLDESGRLVAIAVWRSGRLAPEKVLIEAPARRPAEAELRAERDPVAGVDADPATPDDL